MAIDSIKYGILRARELATLYYGAWMVGDEKYSGFTLAEDTTTDILQTNPRRIQYEIVLSLNSADGVAVIQIAPRSQIEAGNVGNIALWAGENLQITRTFLTELDLVTKGLSVKVASTATASVYAFVREVLLSPAPVDEIP
ncbi:MAG: hypothetical protein WCA44_09070 [Acidobacteriaceae bacterium]